MDGAPETVARVFASGDAPLAELDCWAAARCRWDGRTRCAAVDYRSPGLDQRILLDADVLRTFARSSGCGHGHGVSGCFRQLLLCYRPEPTPLASIQPAIPGERTA